MIDKRLLDVNLEELRKQEIIGDTTKGKKLQETVRKALQLDYLEFETCHHLLPFLLLVKIGCYLASLSFKFFLPEIGNKRYMSSIKSHMMVHYKCLEENIENRNRLIMIMVFILLNPLLITVKQRT